MSEAMRRLSDAEMSADQIFKRDCELSRNHIKALGEGVRRLMDAGVFHGEQSAPGQHGEMKANIMLAYRHLEDARMRIGKALQAFDGGVSVYDK